MQQLKVCFTGVGSIAKRHIRNLQAVCDARDIRLQIDAYRHSVKSNYIEGIQNSYNEFEKVPNDYDVIFITNPTELHLETLKQFCDKGKHFFIEKPVVSHNQISLAKQVLLKNNSIYYVACPLRYNAVIQYIKKNVCIDNVISVRSISSSYLPDWRPGQDYRQTYSAHKKLGGGVSIDLIHEWDYLTYIFGWPKHIKSFIGKISDLEIDSDDYAIYIAEFDKRIAELHLDYFGRKTIREIQLFTKDDPIIGDIANNKITFLTTGKGIEFKEERDDFQRRELEHFLDMVQEDVPTENGYEHGIKVLELTQGCL